MPKNIFTILNVWINGIKYKYVIYNQMSPTSCYAGQSRMLAWGRVRVSPRGIIPALPPQECLQCLTEATQTLSQCTLTRLSGHSSLAQTEELLPSPIPQAHGRMPWEGMSLVGSACHVPVKAGSQAAQVVKPGVATWTAHYQGMGSEAAYQDLKPALRHGLQEF